MGKAFTIAFSGMLDFARHGAKKRMRALPEIGARLRIGFELGGGLVESEGHVVHSNLRGTAMSPMLPQGVGIAFDGLDFDSESAIEDHVKARLARFAP